MAVESGNRLIKTLILGVLSVIPYWALIPYSRDISHSARAPADVCLVVQGDAARYLQKPAAATRAEKRGVMQKGNWLFVLSYVAAVFTACSGMLSA